MNSQNGQLSVGLMAQLVEHCIGIAEALYVNSHYIPSDFNFEYLELACL